MINIPIYTGKPMKMFDYFAKVKTKSALLCKILVTQNF